MAKLNLKVDPPSKFDGKFPYFREPQEIGHFSLDNDRNFCDNSHQLKYFVVPHQLLDLCMDLNEGYSNTIRKNFASNEKIDAILKWILAHQDQFKNCFTNTNSNVPNIDFVCFRGLLTAICATVYEDKDDWLICATKYKSVIYLCAFDTEQVIRRRTHMTEKEHLMSAWGYKFEQYLTSSDINSKPNISEPVNENEEYASVIKGRLQSHNIMFCAEIDGVDPSYLNNPEKNPHSMQRYIELKTSRIITNPRQDRNFRRYKLIKWWLQSFLAGVPKVICGFRDDDGIVRDLKIYDIKELFRMADGLWSPSACLNFCSYFLDFVKKCVIKDDPFIVYKFYWKPQQDITCEELSAPSEYQILPEWYISNLKDVPHKI